MEILEKFFKGVTHYKTTPREESDHASHGSKRKELESAFPTKPDKGRAR